MSHSNKSSLLINAHLIDYELLSHHVRRVILQLPEHSSFSYQAGQYLYLVLSNGEERPYSIASAPNENLLEFHIHHSPYETNFTHQLFEELLKNKTIQLHGPFGHCIYIPPKKQSRLILLAGGTGFAPCKAIIEAAIANQHHATPIELYWGVRTPEHIYEKALLEKWQQTYPWFRGEPIIFNPETGNTDYRTGMVHEVLIEDYPHLENLLVYASGPSAMVLTAHKALLENGLPAQQFCSDYT